mgnify:CR=1 FL=1
MLGQLNAWLAELHFLSGPLGWIALALFFCAIVLEQYDREYARWVYIGAWIVFAGLWFTLIQPFFVVDESVIRGIGAVIATPLSLLVAKFFYEGRDSLFTLSRAVAIMGFVYAPFLMIEPLREQLILLVTGHAESVMNLLGYHPPLVTELSEAANQVPAGTNPDMTRTISGKERAYENTFVFFNGDGTITFTIILACTGIGSMAVVVGLIAAVSADLKRKLQAIALSVAIVYVLNIVRNVFIAIGYGHQYAHFAPDLTMTIFGLENSLRVSYIWVDRIMAQSASVVAMLLIIWLVVRIVPEVMEPIEDVLYLLTGKEHDLAGALNLDVDTGPAAD